MMQRRVIVGAPDRIRTRQLSDKRAIVEFSLLENELALADTQLMAQEDAHTWQTTQLLEQHEGFRSQMRTGTGASMAAAAMAAEELKVALQEQQRLKDVVAKLRAQVASLRGEKQRLEKDAPPHQSGSNGASAMLLSPTSSTTMAPDNQAHGHKMNTEVEQTRQQRVVRNLERDKQRLVNAIASLRSDKVRLTKELNAREERAVTLKEELSATQAQMQASLTLATVAAAEASAVQAQVQASLRARLDEAEKASVSNDELSRRCECPPARWSGALP